MELYVFIDFVVNTIVREAASKTTLLSSALPQGSAWEEVRISEQVQHFFGGAGC